MSAESETSPRLVDPLAVPIGGLSFFPFPVVIDPVPVPVTVNSSSPNVALEPAVIVSVDSRADEDTEGGEKEPVRPLPRSETLSDTEEVNSGAGLNVTV